MVFLWGMSLPISVPTHNLYCNKKYNDYNDKVDNYYSNISRSCPLYGRTENKPSSFEDYFNKNSTSLSISAGGGSSPICPDKRMHVIMMMKPREEIENYKNEIIEKNDIELAKQEIDNDIMKESLETTSSLESYMIMYLSESEDEEPDDYNNKTQTNIEHKKIEQKNDKKIQHDSKKNKIKKEKQKNKDNVPFFESDDFPFNDQTFEDVALYLWNQQQQYEMEDQTF